MNGNYFKRLSSSLDTRPLLKAIETYPDLWNEITARQKTAGSPHIDTQTIFLRWSPRQTLEAVFNDLEAVDYPAMKALPEANSVINFTARLLGATEIGRAIIVKLKPGGFIIPHADEGAYADHFERFHFVLQSYPGNRFMVGEPAVYETCVMRPGEIWWFNHKRTHWVQNDSVNDRVHLIMDMVAPKYKVERAA